MDLALYFKRAHTKTKCHCLSRARIFMLSITARTHMRDVSTYDVHKTTCVCIRVYSRDRENITTTHSKTQKSRARARKLDALNFCAKLASVRCSRLSARVSVSRSRYMWPPHTSQTYTQNHTLLQPTHITVK